MDTVTIFGPGDFDDCGDPCCSGTLYADGLAVAGAMGVTFCFTRVVKILKKEQAASEVAIEQLAGGGRIRSERRVVQHEDN